MTVNGKRVYELGVRVHPTKDKVVLDGRPLRSKPELLYIMMHKPTGVLTTMHDPGGRPCIGNMVEQLPYRVFPVGRLDWDSEGLILLTNDGEYANRVMNPKFDVTKTYLVKLDGQPDGEKLQKLLRGVSIIGGKVAAKAVEKVKRGRDQYAWIRIVITEGKNRQVRQMFAKIGFDVKKLQRIAIGRLRLGKLDRGQMVFLNHAAAQRVFLQDEKIPLEPQKHLLTKPKVAGVAVGASRSSGLQKASAKTESGPSIREKFHHRKKGSRPSRGPQR